MRHLTLRRRATNRRTLRRRRVSNKRTRTSRKMYKGGAPENIDSLNKLVYINSIMPDATYQVKNKTTGKITEILKYDYAKLSNYINDEYEVSAM